MKRAVSKADSKKRTPAKDMDEYLAAIPADQRAALQKLRKAIQAAAPGAIEVISYQMPAFRYRGRLLVCFAAFKNHCSFFPMSLKAVRVHASDLRGYDAERGTIRFPAAKPLTAALVRKIVKTRIAENEAKNK